MRYYYLAIKDGKRRIIWPTFVTFVLMVYGVVIGAAELFWVLFTGGFSLLIGGYALVTATLILIRVVGASLTMPIDQLGARLDST